MSAVQSAAQMSFDAKVAVLVIGAGAAGLVAALTAQAEGADVLVVERDSLPRGSTALSAGLIPAAGTRWQRDAGVYDDPDLFASDVVRKAHGQTDRAAAATVTFAIGPILEWLADKQGLPFSLITNFTYPGHSAQRMHGLPSRSGQELIDRLRDAASAAGIDILTDAHATTLFADTNGRVVGIEISRPDGARERIGCDQLVLACNGYGGNKALVAAHIPALANALYFGHPGNQGDALVWGEALGAATHDLPGHQGHGSVATPHGILITWATMTEGGFQVNRDGMRFADESRGYSEHAADVLHQPDGIAFSVFDGRIAAIARQFEDFRTAEAQRAVLTGENPAALAEQLHVPAAAFLKTFASVEAAKAAGATDELGRNWRGATPLGPPFHAVKVTGALFHTQGGLAVDSDARVLRPDRTPLPNLYAAGGAACGVSGPEASGYLSGNGLLTAVAYGHLAGRSAARRALGRR